MKRKLRIGILGCARIVRRGVAEGIKSSGTATLTAIASRQPDTAASWAQEFDIPKHYGSYEALIADREIDAVYIPLPNEMHLPWTVRAAEAGKHVLCEKPLALDSQTAESMVEACRQRNVILLEAFMWRHHPRTLHALHMVQAGQLGDLRLVKMDFSFDIDRGDWRLDAQRGGGAMFDLGCYGINAARLFTGQEPVEVLARARFHDTGVDLTSALQLRFACGALALLDCSFECPYRNRIELVGTRGTLELPEGVLPPPSAELVYRQGESIETIHFPTAQQYAEEVKAFCASVQARQLVAPAEDGLANMRVLEEAWRSARLV